MPEDKRPSPGGAQPNDSDTRPLPTADAPSETGDPSRIDVRGMIKQASRRVHVDQLVRRGTKYLSLLSKEKIDELINQAVQTIIRKHRQGGAAEADGAVLAAEAKQDFGELLSQYQEATQAKTTLQQGRDSMAQELEDMRLELDQQKRIAEGRMDEEAERTLILGFKEFEREVEHSVRKVFDKRKLILENANDPEAVRELDEIEKRLMPIIRKLVAAERARFAGSFAQSRESQLLERRMAKLMEQMAVMENALKLISNQKLFSNQQIANLLRELGLAPEDEAFQKKKEMLKVVLEQNVLLRQQIKELPPGEDAAA